MPVDSKSTPRDKAIAIGAIVFFVVAFIVIYIVAKMTGGSPPPVKP